MRGLLGVCALATVLVGVGCANVHVKKVSVDDRVAGKDHHVRGFRYYMTRPYIVVKEPVATGAEAIAVRAGVLAEEVNDLGKEGELLFVSAAPLPGDKYRCFGADGSEKPTQTKAGLQKLKWKAPAAEVAPPPKQPVALAAMQPTKMGSSGMTTPQPKGTKNTTDETTPAADPEGKFAVVHLPDFEEMYAIRHTNVAAKSAYKYAFADGSKLATVEGNYNATDVPVKFLNTVQNLIGAVTDVRLAALKKGANAGTGSKLAFDTTDTSVLYILTEQFVEPGVYRVQKSWERVAGAVEAGIAPDQCTGLITELGFAVRTNTRILTAAEFGALLNAQSGN